MDSSNGWHRASKPHGLSGTDEGVVVIFWTPADRPGEHVQPPEELGVSTRSAGAMVTGGVCETVRERVGGVMVVV